MKTVRALLAQQSKYFTPDSLKYNWDDIYLSIDIRYIFFQMHEREDSFQKNSRLGHHCWKIMST